jgi:hypothetical protein
MSKFPESFKKKLPKSLILNLISAFLLVLLFLVNINNHPLGSIFYFFAFLVLVVRLFYLNIILYYYIEITTTNIFLCNFFVCREVFFSDIKFITNTAKKIIIRTKNRKFILLCENNSAYSVVKHIKEMQIE